MEQSPSWEANKPSVSQEIPCILWNQKVHYHIHRPVANLSCFQKGASYSGIRIFNSLPQSITNLKNEKTQFKVALKKFLNAHSFTLCMNFSHVQMICITDYMTVQMYLTL